MDQRRLKRLGKSELQNLKRLAIDEVPVGKLHRFLTLVYDLDRGTIVSVSKGRGQKALTAVFSRLKRAGVCIRAVATDMAGGYAVAVMKHLWPTQLVFDRFHVQRLMNEKLSQLRRERYRELKDVQQRDVLKGVRWLLVKNPENLKQTARVDERSRLQTYNADMLQAASRRAPNVADKTINLLAQRMETCQRGLLKAIRELAILRRLQPRIIEARNTSRFQEPTPTDFTSQSNHRSRRGSKAKVR